MLKKIAVPLKEFFFDVVYPFWYAILPIDEKVYDVYSVAILKRFRVAIVLLFFSIFIGTVGYFIIWNYVEPTYSQDKTFLHSLYTSVIVLSSVGLGNVNELHSIGKLFTITLILINLFFYSYAVSIISTIIKDGGISMVVKNFRMAKSISQLINHTIVCGYGRVGQKVVKQLLSDNDEIVVIDQREANEKYLQQDFPAFFGKKLFFQHGDAGFDDVLDKANIQHAKCLVIATPSETKNVFIVLSAKRKKKELYIVSRAVQRDDEEKLKMAGADNVIIPEREGALHMALLVKNRNMITFFDLLAGANNNSEFMEVYGSNINRTKPNLTIGDIQSFSGVNVIAINGTLNPPFSSEIKENDDKYVIWGNPTQMADFKKTFLK